VGDAVTDLHQLTDDLEQLREEVDYLISLLEPDLDPTTGALLGQPVNGSGTSPVRIACANIWHTLTPRAAGHAWDALAEWVDWLLDRYGLDDTIPSCWYRHGAMTDELDALRAAWIAAYLDDHARPIDAAFWHDLLDRALTRLRNWDRYGCNSGTHHDDTPTLSDSAALQARTDYLHRQIDTGAPRPIGVPANVPPDIPAAG
jgi:hypothetical protein